MSEPVRIVGEGGLTILITGGTEDSPLFEIRDDHDRILLKPKGKGYIVGRYEELNQDAKECMKRILAAVFSSETGVTDHMGNPLTQEEMDSFLDFQEEDDELCG